MDRLNKSLVQYFSRFWRKYNFSNFLTFKKLEKFCKIDFLSKTKKISNQSLVQPIPMKLALLFLPLWFLFAEESCAVTYEFSGGRFGDCLISYLHAKWYSFHNDIPLLYKKFHYSNDLVLSDKEEKYLKKKNLYPIEKVFKTGLVYSKEPKTLYVIPFFPETFWERRKDKFPYFEVDWNNSKFKKEIKKLIAPKKVLKLISLPNNCMTVAIHFRTGGGFDPPDARINYALKLPPEDYYYEQLLSLYNLLSKQHLYVFIFTDDPKPLSILEKFKKRFSLLDIEFDCRKESIGGDKLVLEDFFSLLKFDCLIRPESNFSFVAAKLTDYLVEIYPVDCIKKNQKIIINQVNLVYKKPLKVRTLQ